MRQYFYKAALLLALTPMAALGQTQVVEGSSGRTTVLVSVPRLDPNNTAAVTGTYQTIDGTATAADNDYIAASGTFSFGAGQPSTDPIPIEIVGDVRVEPNETFTIRLTTTGGNPQLPIPGAPTITIVNDDTPVTRPGLSGPVAPPVGTVLDRICESNNPRFVDVCAALSRLDDEQVSRVLESVAPQQSGVQSKLAGQSVAHVTTGIGSRLAALRKRTPPPAALRPMTSADGDDGDYNGWSAFLSADVGSGERIADAGQLGFDLDSRGIMLGVDRQLGEGILGLALNLLQVDSTLDSSAGTLDTNGFALSVYGSRGGLFASTTPSAGSGLHCDGLHLDGSLTLGRNRYDSEHVVDLAPLPLSRARSRNDANLFAVAAVAGVEAHRGRIDFDAALSGTWSRASIDDLTESGPGPLILFVEGHEIESAVGAASLHVTGAWPVSFGNLIPSFRGELLHEFKGDARVVTARFLQDQLGTSFTVPIDRPDADYGRLAIGLQGVFARGYSAFVEFSQDVLRSDLHFRTLQFNVSKSF